MSDTPDFLLHVARRSGEAFLSARFRVFRNDIVTFCDEDGATIVEYRDMEGVID